MSLARLLAFTAWDLLHALSVLCVLLAPLAVLGAPVVWLLIRR